MQATGVRVNMTDWIGRQLEGPLSGTLRLRLFLAGC